MYAHLSEMTLTSCRFSLEVAFEDVIAARNQSFALSNQLKTLIALEAGKGCTRALSPMPVRLEPQYQSFSELSLHAQPMGAGHVVESGFDWRRWVRFRLWISTDQKFDWVRCESFLKQLACVENRIGFEITGNRASIEISLLCHRRDVPFVHIAFSAQFASCRLMSAKTPMLHELNEHSQPVQFHDFHPPPPYHHPLSTFEELRTSPLEPLLCALHEVRPPAIGFYQCLFEPTSPGHDWRRNLQCLHDLEYSWGLQSENQIPTPYPQQSPSNDLHSRARQVDEKAHNDKPLFACAIRIGLIGRNDYDEAYLRALRTCMGLFLHGGRSLERLCHKDYEDMLNHEAQTKMICQGRVYRPGFLLNSRELCGFAHVFCTSMLEDREISLNTLHTLPLKQSAPTRGTCVGVSEFGDRQDPVFISQATRECATHIVASSGMGKSTVMMNMFLQDIQEGIGAVFIDAHGDSIEQLMRMIPTHLQDKCVHFDPGNPDWIPLWNPLHVPKGGDAYRMADDLLSALERVSKDWGDRLAHVLRNGLIGLSYLPQQTLLDLYQLVRQKSSQSDELRKRIVDAAIDEPVRAFWDRDFLKDYREADLASPKHKLHKLIAGGSVSLMLSQPRSVIQFRQIMDEGKILLVDLSRVGAETRETLGSLMLTLFMMAAISRSDTAASKRKPFSIFADEAHLFVSADAIENIVAQARKFRVSLCIAHQYLKQFKSSQIDALSTVGSTILGRLDKRDSQYFSKDLQDLVNPADLISLKPYEMIARIGSEIVRLKTTPLPSATHDGSRIVERSRQAYCARAGDIRLALNSRGKKHQPRGTEAAPNDNAFGFTQADLAYDEF